MPSPVRTIDPVALPFCGRGRWLGHPAFLACVVVLVLNDHVLKDRFPGWWAGKLSDVAGVAVAGVVLAVLVGPRRGLLVAAGLFILLKVVPGVAEAASPLLGGETRRDPTDLIALVVLIPLRRLLGSAEHRLRPSLDDRSSLRATWSRCRASLSAVTPVVGAVLAVASATATSCAPSPAVTAVAADQQALFALVRGDGTSSSQWARSTDGGRSWQRSDPPAGTTSTNGDEDRYEDPGPAGPLEACIADGTCWRLQDRRVVERRADNGPPTEELRLSDAEFSEIDTGCIGGSVGVLGSIAATDGDSGPQVVASLGADGVLVRQDDGTWEQVRVLSAPPVEASGLEIGALAGLLLFGPAMAVMLWLVGWHRWPSWPRGIVVVGVGWLTTLTVAGIVFVSAGPDTDPVRITGRVAIAGIAVTTIAAVVVARRPRGAPASTRTVTPVPPAGEPPSWRSTDS